MVVGRRVFPFGARPIFRGYVKLQVGILGIYTLQLYEDYFINNPIITNQDSMESRRVFFSWIRYFWMSSLRVTHKNTTRKQKNGSRMFKASSLLQTSMTIPWKSNTIFCGLVYEAPFILSRDLSSSKMNHHVLNGG